MSRIAQSQLTMELGARCYHDMDCTDFVKGSVCSMAGYCECAPYFVRLNESTCLQCKYSEICANVCVIQCTTKNNIFLILDHCRLFNGLDFNFKFFYLQIYLLQTVTKTNGKDNNF